MKAYLAAVLLAPLLVGGVAPASKPAKFHGRQQAEAAPFPLAVGTEWTYVGRTSWESRGGYQTTSGPDTVVIRIVDTVTHALRKRTAMHWTVHETGIFHLTPRDLWVSWCTPPDGVRDTLVFDRSPLDSIPYFIFVFPLRVDAVWACKQCSQMQTPTRIEARVESTENVTTPSGEFERAYHVALHGKIGILVQSPGFDVQDLPDDWAIQTGDFDYWIKPGVGFVKLRQSLECTDCDIKQVTFEWNLLSWKAGDSSDD